jgi:dienelactone hydrolase
VKIPLRCVLAFALAGVFGPASAVGPRGPRSPVRLDDFESAPADPEPPGPRPLAEPRTLVYGVTAEHLFFPARIDGRDCQLEAMLYRPSIPGPRPLVVFSHGRAGMYPARDPNMVNWYPELCTALAAEGWVVAYIVRRGYGNSDGPDVELQDTAVLSGLEGAKDYAAAVAYWRTRDFVRPDCVVIMGQSQGGWVTLAGTTVAMPGVIGAVNISGGTNYRLMGTGAVTGAVQNAWVAGCTELGRAALVPSFWVYSENDLSISGPTARRMFDAFTAAGGTATLLMLPPFGTNGHGIVGQPGLFQAPMDDFFAAIGFNDLPDAPPVIGPLSGADTVSLGGTAVFTAGVSGSPPPALQWRRDGFNLADGGDVSGATAATLRIAHLQAADAGSYTLRATNRAGSAVSEPLVVQFPATAPSILAQPQNQTVTSGGAATFTVSALGYPAPTYRWQRAPAGTNTWADLAEGNGFAGVASATLTVGATTGMSGDAFRCVATNAAGAAASAAVLLTVTAPPAPAPAPSSGGGGALPVWWVAALAALGVWRMAGGGKRDAGGKPRLPPSRPRRFVTQYVTNRYRSYQKGFVT